MVPPRHAPAASRSAPLLPGRALAALAAVLLTSRAFAHEKWFHDADPYPIDLSSAFALPTLPFVVGPVLATLLAGWAWRARGRRSVLPGPAALGGNAVLRSAFYGVLPAIVAAHMAVPLLVGGVQGTLFAPATVLSGAWPYLFGLVQIGVALSWFYGGLARPAAVAIAIVWVAGLAVAGVEPMLESVHVLGFAAFFFLAGRGPIAVDRLLFPRLEPSARAMRAALPALRIGVGLGLVVLAFTEKLANLPLATAFLQDHPINVPAALGLPVSDALFARTAGAVELLVGLFLVFGLFQRAVILLAWLPFNLTLSVFGWVELVGHLPIYGAMAALLVWDGAPEERALWLRGLREGPLAVRGHGVAATEGVTTDDAAPL